MVGVRVGGNDSAKFGDALARQIGDNPLPHVGSTCINEHGFTAGKEQGTIPLADIQKMYGSIFREDRRREIAAQKTAEDKEKQDKRDQKDMGQGIFMPCTAFSA